MPSKLTVCFVFVALQILVLHTTAHGHTAYYPNPDEMFISHVSIEEHEEEAVIKIRCRSGEYAVNVSYDDVGLSQFWASCAAVQDSEIAELIPVLYSEDTWFVSALYNCSSLLYACVLPIDTDPARYHDGEFQAVHIVIRHFSNELSYCLSDKVMLDCFSYCVKPSMYHCDTFYFHEALDGVYRANANWMDVSEFEQPYVNCRLTSNFARTDEWAIALTGGNAGPFQFMLVLNLDTDEYAKIALPQKLLDEIAMYVGSSIIVYKTEVMPDYRIQISEHALIIGPGDKPHHQLWMIDYLRILHRSMWES